MDARRYPILLSILAALALAACGGDDSPETQAKETTAEAKPTLSKEELISQGDAICAEVNAAVASIGSSAASPETQAGQVAELYDNMVASLLRLGTPSESEGYSEFIQAAEELAKAEGEVRLAVERGETESEAASNASLALEEFEAQAAVYGFEECSQGPGAVTPAPETGGEAEGGVEVAPEGEIEEVAPEEEIAPEEEVAPETGGAGGGVEEAAPEEAAPEGGGGGGSESGGVGPG